MENLFGCNTLLPRINISGKKNEQNGKEQNRGKCIQFRFDSFAKFCVEHGGEGIDPGSFGKIGDGKSSSDMVTAIINPENTPGRISGQVTL